MEYLSALELGKTWRSAWNILRKVENPVNALRRLDDVLNLTNERLVIIIEDLDRNAEEDLLDVVLPALLDRLSEMKCITFVLTIEMEAKNTRWLHRVCDYEQRIPRIEEGVLLDIIHRFRDISRARFSYVDPARVEEAEKRFSKNFGTDRRKRRSVRGLLKKGEILDEADAALAFCLSTPRFLKYVLHHVDQVWKTLAGEVIFDELLVITAIQRAYPEVYDFIVFNMEFLRNQMESSNEGVEENAPVKKKNEELSTILTEAGSSPTDQLVVNTLIHFLFSGWKVKAVSRSVFQQSVVQSPLNHATDYWARIENGRLGENELSDQEVLGAIKQCSTAEGQREVAIKVFDDSSWAIKVRSLGRALPSATLRAVLSKYFDLYLEKGKFTLRDTIFIPHMIEIIENRKAFNQDHYQWLHQELQRVVRVSLQLANRIFHFCSHCEYNILYLKAVQDYIDCVKNTWETDSDLLIQGVKNSESFALCQFMISLPNAFLANQFFKGKENSIKWNESDPEQEYSFCPDDWHWLAGMLVKALDRHEYIILPQMADLFVSQNILYDVTEQAQFSFNEELGRAFLSDSFESVMERFVALDPASFEDSLRERLICISNWVSEHL